MPKHSGQSCWRDGYATPGPSPSKQATSEKLSRPREPVLGRSGQGPGTSGKYEAVAAERASAGSLRTRSWDVREILRQSEKPWTLENNNKQCGW